MRSAMPSARASASSFAQQRPAADVRETPVQFARQQRERVQQVVESLLVDGAADGQQRDRARRIRCRRGDPAWRPGRGKRVVSMPW